MPFPQRMGKPERFAALVAHMFSTQDLNDEVIRLDNAVGIGAK